MIRLNKQLSDDTKINFLFTTESYYIENLSIVGKNHKEIFLYILQ